MPKSEFGGGSRWLQAIGRRVARALRPFRGSASGATLVEYLIVVGFCAFIAILGFYRFGRILHSHLRVEARHIEGKGMPGGEDMDAFELLNVLGEMTAFEPQDLIEDVVSGSGFSLPSGMDGMDLDPVMSQSGGSLTDQMGAGATELLGGSGSPSPLAGGTTDTESSSLPSDTGRHSILPGSGASADSLESGFPGDSETSTGFPSPLLPGGATDTESSSTLSEAADTGSASPAPMSPALVPPEPTGTPGT